MTLATRRTLHFDSIDDVFAEVDRLFAAAREGRLATAGQWGLPTILNHLAMWAEYAYTGAPLKVPFVMRMLLRVMKKQMLYKPMRAGVRLPKVEGGTLGIDTNVSLEAALGRFRAAFGRLQNEAPTMPHLLFGKMTQAEWTAMHLRHAELHLSFAVPS